jgi:carbamate kinase
MGTRLPFITKEEVMSNIIVLALGGNALGNDPEEQKEAVRHTSKSIVDLIEAGNQVILSHGNGPQVGMINLAMDAASKSEAGTPEMPFPECGAMSQGYIGYHLQNAIQNELKSRGINKSVATVVTQVVVDKNDPAFQNPTNLSLRKPEAWYSRQQVPGLKSQELILSFSYTYTSFPPPIRIKSIFRCF